MVVAVKALAGELPAESGVPLSRWGAPELVGEAVARGVVETISASTVRRWLAGDVLKAWQHRTWIYPRAPDFAAKAARALDLYAGFWDGEPLGDNDFVICADEKTSIQVRCRCHPTLPPGRARMMRVEHEYERRGALAYLAAYDVHHARVIGRMEPTTGIEPFGRLVEQVMTAEPYAGAERVFWVVDNGSSHRGQRTVKFQPCRCLHLSTTMALGSSERRGGGLNQFQVRDSIEGAEATPPLILMAGQSAFSSLPTQATRRRGRHRAARCEARGYSTTY